MIYCTNCGKALEDDALFCENCGTKVAAEEPAPAPAPAPEPVPAAEGVCPQCGEVVAPELSFCPKCGEMITRKAKKEKPAKPAVKVAECVCPQCGSVVEADGAFCIQCGATLPGKKTVKAPAAEEKATSAEAAPKAKGFDFKAFIAPVVKKLKAVPKKVYMFVGIGLAVLLAVIILLSILGGMGDMDYVLYVKDNQLAFNDGSEEKNVTTGLYTINLGADGESVAEEISAFIAKSKDGKRLFYPDRIGMDSSFGGGLPLYYRDLDNMGKDPVRVDSNVDTYAINPEGTKVVYLKNDGGLYIHDLKEKDKIAGNVRGFVVSEDLKTVIYLNDSGAMYLWRSGEELQKLVSDVQSLHYITKDLSTVFFTKEDTLFKYVIAEGQQIKIAENVEDIVAVYDSGKLYYTVKQTQSYTLMDYVNDDMAAQDANITQPEYPDYPSKPSRPYRYQYDSTEEYEEAYAQYEQDLEEYNAEYDRMRTEYEAARQAWREKQSRESLRENLRNWQEEGTVYTLFFYDGEKTSVAAEMMENSYIGSYAKEAPVLVTKVYVQESLAKVNLTEVESIYDLRDQVESALYGKTEVSIVAEANAKSLGNYDASNYKLAADGSFVCFFVEAGDAYDLYKVSVTGVEIADAELYDTEVSRYGFSIQNGKICYFKYYNDESRSGDLYVDKTEVDFDVLTYNVACVGDSVLYFTDWNDYNGSGTLKVFKDSKKEKIAEDVSYYYAEDEKNILYLKDYELNEDDAYTEGVLYRYNGSKSSQLAVEVDGLVLLSNNRMKGSNSVW